MKNLVKLNLLVVGVLAVVSTGLLAGDLPARGPIPFSDYDTNKDGTVSESEFNDVRATRMSEKASQGMPMKNAANAPAFNEFDTDHDGKLTKVELLEGQNKQMQKNRSNMGSGQMGNNMKGMGRNAPTFESYDLNGDGFLTENELNEAREKRVAQKASEGKMMKNSGNQTKFSEIDTNNDGKISKEEFLANQMKKRGSAAKKGE
ncbi:MAG: EF-hand domain-containing protein [Sulfurimonas sp.]